MRDDGLLGFSDTLGNWEQESRKMDWMNAGDVGLYT